MLDPQPKGDKVVMMRTDYDKLIALPKEAYEEGVYMNGETTPFDESETFAELEKLVGK